MERDKYLGIKARQDVVTAFISKLEKTEMTDINIIPALMDYINTGNMQMFNEYYQFHQMADTEKKAKEMEERLTKAKEDLESRKSDWKDISQRADEYRRKTNDIIIKYHQWVVEMRDITINENPQAASPTIKTLRDFAQNCIDEYQGGGQRKLYLKDGDKLKTVTAILFDGKKAVIEAGEPTTILTPIKI